MKIILEHEWNTFLFWDKCKLWSSLLLFSHSVVSDSATPWTVAGQVSLPITISQSLLKLTSFEVVMPSNHLILCHLFLFLPSDFPSFPQSESFPDWLFISNEKDWSFSFSVSPSNGYSRLISFRFDWFDLLAVQGTLKSLLQHHSSKASIPGCLAYSYNQ